MGVALAGGQSKRMGRDKTLLTWPPGAEDGKPLWRHAWIGYARSPKTSSSRTPEGAWHLNR